MPTAPPSHDSAGSPGAIALEVAGLSVSYGGFRAVSDLSFELRRGQTLAIVGESGSGKSTIALALMRLLSPNTAVDGQMLFHRPGGTIDLLAQDEAGMRQIRGSEISMIFQEPMTSLNPVMTIGAQISEAVRLHQDVSAKEARQIALDSLARARIADADRKFGQYPHQLSGGMRQRVMIAMALACRPAVLIADEPTTALDVTVQAEMLKLIRDLQREVDMAVIYITHDLGVVAQVADHVVVMQGGRVVESQEVTALFERPREKYTRRLLSSVPVLGAASDSDGPVKFHLDEDPCPSPAAEMSPPAPMERQTVLEVRSLSKAFVIERTAMLRSPTHVLQAVSDVSFDLRRGETVAVVGESGSGKSTMARTVLQLVAADAGSVKLNGQELVGLGRGGLRPHRARMQMVFQDPYASLNPKMTVSQLIAEPLVIHGCMDRGKTGAVVRGLLERVGLPADFQDRLPRQLSGGQRQRVCIARALSTRPDVIVLDEAVSALDVTVQAQIVNLLIDLQRDNGLSYLFISHDMGIVERISHRVAVMHMGRIVEFGCKRKVLHSPAHPYTKRLLSAVLRPDPSARAQVPPQLSAMPTAIRPVSAPARKARYQAVGLDHEIIVEDEIAA